jgi:hypothetical protein
MIFGGVTRARFNPESLILHFRQKISDWPFRVRFHTGSTGFMVIGLKIE